MCIRDRDHSWKRLLRFGTNTIEHKQSYVKAVMDDPEFNSNELKNSLTTICRKALESSDIEPWRKVFIQHKELMVYCNQGFIEKSQYEFILLNESQRNHYHCEFYTKALELELHADKSLIEPFSRLRYVPVKSREDSAHVLLSGFKYDEQQYQIEVHKSRSCFDIRVKGGDIENAPEKLTDLLEKDGFELGGFSMPSIGYHKYFGEQSQQSIEDVKKKVQHLCANLKNLDSTLLT